MTYTGTPTELPADGLYDRVTTDYPSWTNQANVENQLAEIEPQFSREDYAILLSAIRGGLPVIVKWAYHDGFSDTHTVVVKWMHINKGSSANRIRVKYWGFEHDLYLTHIQSIAVAH